MTVCIYDENCDNADVEYELGTATDFCAEADDIQYRYIVDGTIFGHGNVLNESLSVGEHAVYLIARDLCGNEDTAHLYITLVDCKAPTPYCYNGIATVVMPNTNEVTVWARDLDAGSFDNCTDQDDLRFTFTSTHPDEDSTYVEEDRSGYMTFDCDQLGEVTVTIYVWDEEDNFDFCETYLLIQPGIGACQESQSATIIGNITTESAEAVEFAEVSLKLNDSPMTNFMTGVDGKFVFSGVQMNQSYKVQPVRNDAADNGVSTLDLVFIQKHILGIDKLVTPYKLIAADINSSSSITALDLVELRKLILGLYTEFPNNQSWRFVDAAYEFANAQEPWNFAEYKDITMTDQTVGADFIAVKVGDVNGTVQANSALLGAEVRNSDKLVFQVTDQQVEAGQEVVVSFSARNFNAIEGYQFTMSTKGLDYVNSESGSITVSSDNFGIHSDKGLITTSWNSERGVTSSDALYSITFTANTSGSLSELLSINSAITKAESYNNKGIGGVTIEFVRGDEIVSSGLNELYQNNPNPFGSETIIGFTLAEEGAATLKVMDVTGRLVKLYEGDFGKGYNQFKVMKKDLTSAGVLYYQLRVATL